MRPVIVAIAAGAALLSACSGPDEQTAARNYLVSDEREAVYQETVGSASEAIWRYMLDNDLFDPDNPPPGYIESEGEGQTIDCYNILGLYDDGSVVIDSLLCLEIDENGDSDPSQPMSLGLSLADGGYLQIQSPDLRPDANYDYFFAAVADREGTRPTVSDGIGKEPELSDPHYLYPRSFEELQALDEEALSLLRSTMDLAAPGWND